MRSVPGSKNDAILKHIYGMTRILSSVPGPKDKEHLARIQHGLSTRVTTPCPEKKEAGVFSA